MTIIKNPLTPDRWFGPRLPLDFGREKLPEEAQRELTQPVIISNPPVSHPLWQTRKSNAGLLPSLGIGAALFMESPLAHAMVRVGDAIQQGDLSAILIGIGILVGVTFSPSFLERLKKLYEATEKGDRWTEVERRLKSPEIVRDFETWLDIEMDLSSSLTEEGSELIRDLKNGVKKIQTDLQEKEIWRLRRAFREAGGTFLGSPDEKLAEIVRRLVENKPLIEWKGKTPAIFESELFGMIDVLSLNKGLEAFRNGEGQVRFLAALAVVTGKLNWNCQSLPKALKEAASEEKRKEQGWMTILTDWRRADIILKMVAIKGGWMQFAGDKGHKEFSKRFADGDKAKALHLATALAVGPIKNFGKTLGWRRTAEDQEVEPSPSPAQEAIPAPVTGIAEVEADTALPRKHEFSPLAQKGYEHLCKQFPNIRDHLDRFLVNPAILTAQNHPGLMDEILETIYLLYEARIFGYQNGFIPSRFDDKFLSDHISRILSLLKEFQHAFLYKTDLEVERLWVSYLADVDWETDLSQREENYINEFIKHNLSENLATNYKRQKKTELDFAAQYWEDGIRKRRIVEIKTSEGVFEPSAEEMAELRLQGFRHALVRRHSLRPGKHPFEGVEYIFDVKDIRPETYFKLQEFADEINMLGCPCLIRILTKVQGEIVIEGGLPVISPRKEASDSRPHSMGKSRKEKKGDKAGSKYPWNKKMAYFLDDLISAFPVKRVFDVESFLRIARANLRTVHQERIIKKIEDYLEEHPETESTQIRDLLGQFRRAQKETLNPSDSLLLVRIAALATQTPWPTNGTSSNSEEIKEVKAPAPAVDERLFLIQSHYQQMKVILQECRVAAEEHRDSERFLEEVTTYFSALEDSIVDRESLVATVGQMEDQLRQSPHPILLGLKKELEECVLEIEKLSQEKKNPASPEESTPVDSVASAVEPSALLLEAIPVDVLNQYPELVLADEENVEKQIRLRAELAQPGARQLFQLLTLLKLYESKLGPKGRGEAQDLFDEIDTSSEAIEGLTGLAFQAYDSFRDEIISALSPLDWVGLLPEIRGEGARLEGITAGKALLRYLTERALPEEWYQFLLKLFYQLEGDSDFTAVYLSRVAAYYRDRSKEIPKLSPFTIPEEYQRAQRLEEEFPEFDLVSDEKLKSEDLLSHAGAYLILKLQALLNTFLNDLPEGSPMIRIRDDLLRPLRFLKKMTNRGASLPHLIERVSQDVLARYRSHQPAIRSYLAIQLGGIQNLVASFPEVRREKTSPINLVTALTGISFPKLEGFNTAVKVVQILLRANGKYRNLVEEVLGNFEPSSESFTLEQIAESLEKPMNRLLEYYLKHRKEILGILATRTKDISFFSLEAYHRETEELTRSHRELQLISDETTSGLKNLYRSLLTSPSTPVSIFQRTGMVLTVLDAPPLQKMGMLIAMNFREDEPLRREIRNLSNRTSTLLMLGLDPAWVLINYRKRMLDSYKRAVKR